MTPAAAEQVASRMVRAMKADFPGFMKHHGYASAQQVAKRTGIPAPVIYKVVKTGTVPATVQRTMFGIFFEAARARK